MVGIFYTRNKQMVDLGTTFATLSTRNAGETQVTSKPTIPPLNGLNTGD